MDDHHHQVRMHLDVIIGEAKPDNTKVDREHIRDLAGRVGDLNARLRDIRKEQRFQREREAAYRDLSERANFRALIWPTVQAMVLVATCAWQATHLRVSIVAQERASYIADTPRTSHVRHSSTTARSGEEQWRWLLLLCFADASLLRSGCGCASRDRREGVGQSCSSLTKQNTHLYHVSVQENTLPFAEPLLIRSACSALKNRLNGEDSAEHWQRSTRKTRALGWWGRRSHYCLE